MNGAKHDDPRTLLASYLMQLVQAGEKDMYLSAETAAVVRSATPPRGGGAGAEQVGEKPCASQR